MVLLVSFVAATLLRMFLRGPRGLEDPPGYGTGGGVGLRRVMVGGVGVRGSEPRCRPSRWKPQ